MKTMFLAVSIGFLLMLVVQAFPADISPPRKAHKVNPSNHQPELCMVPGRQPSTGQTLKSDQSCKYGMRWVYQE